MLGTLFVVATPIGNLEDITARALRVLREVAVIAAEDTRRTAGLLARYAIRTPTTSLHEHNETKKSSSLIARLERGDDVALVSDAGTPTLSDPGEWLIRAAIDAGLRVETIPGPSAAIAALSVSGFPLSTFTFLGFPPTRSSERKNWFDRLRALSGTVVFFEAPHRVAQTLSDFQRVVGNCQVVVSRELTKAHEELVRGPISSVVGSLSDARGEFTVVAFIGQQTNTNAPGPPGDAQVLREFGEITETRKLSRKKAINVIAKRYGIAPNEVYAAVERARKLAE